MAKTGQSLNETLAALAASVGVLHPEHIRVVEVLKLPFPDDPELRQAALASGLLGPNMIGLTLGYGVVRAGHATIRLMSHEFRHVHQYEQAGSSLRSARLSPPDRHGRLPMPFDRCARFEREDT
jgi:hypothetical protein